MQKNTLQRLKSLMTEQHKRRYPNLPDHTRCIKIPTDSNANGLTRCVITWIELHGFQAERISNTGRMIDRTKVVTDVAGRCTIIGSKEWIPGTGTNGTADISATIKGRSVKIEIKYEKDRQSEAQKQYQADIERAGGVYLIVRDFDEFINWFDNFIQ